MVSKQRLQNITFFEEFSEDEIGKIALILSGKSYKKDAVIWEEGSPAQGLHIIERGKVRVTKRTGEDAKQTFAVLKDNNFYGELSLLDGRSHSASVEALEDTKVLVLSTGDMEKLLQDHPKTAYKIVRKMIFDICEILRDMNNKFMNLSSYIWE
jgi:CRP-like cAMP-binding protein